MHVMLPFFVSTAFLWTQQAPLPCEPDLAQLQEILHDRQDARGQSQAALLLLQSSDPAAEKIIRDSLKHLENEESFIALAGAIRLRPDARFLNELLTGLGASRPRVRQAAAETLAVVPASDLVRRLATLTEDPRADIRVRQAAAWTLGRSGRKEAVSVLVDALGKEGDEYRRIVAAALTDLTGQNHGTDAARWKTWWARHKDLPAEQWLQLRLTFQTTRAQRLEGELHRSRAQVLRLHQQLYSRLPVADRFAHLQAQLEQEDPSVRALAIVWCLELLPSADPEKQQTLGKILLRLTRDSTAEVQHAAVLALGRWPDQSAVERLQELIQSGPANVRAASVRALSFQARGTTPEARAKLKQVAPLLHKALEDRALEVVVEAAEALGMLGAPEAGPVLIGLLRHPSEHVRQTAAQALERTADSGLIDSLLRGLDDRAVTVRFGLVGALGKAAGNGENLSAETRKRLCARLEALLKGDADASVRSRAATVLGECGGVEALGVLWSQVETGTEGRVQEKAWDAFVEIVIRSGTLSLAETWDRKLQEGKQGPRRVQFWAKIYSRWERLGTMRDQATRALERLAQVQIDLGKWSAAAPLWQTLLSRSEEGTEGLKTRCLRTLLSIAEHTLKEGNRAEAVRILKEARGYLVKGDKLAEAFETLQKQAEKE